MMSIIYVIIASQGQYEDHYETMVVAHTTLETAQLALDELIETELVDRNNTNKVSEINDQWLLSNPQPRHTVQFAVWCDRYHTEMHAKVLELGLNIDKETIHSWTGILNYEFKFFHIEECELL